MDKRTLEKALQGHENREEILKVLQEPVCPYETADYREGYIVDAPYSLDAQDPAEGQSTVHRLAHWKGGFDPEAFQTRDEGAKAKRALHGLEFMKKPNRNGRYEKLGPSNRAKVLRAYLAQHDEEWG